MAYQQTEEMEDCNGMVRVPPRTDPIWPPAWLKVPTPETAIRPTAADAPLGDPGMRAFLEALGGDLAERWDERAGIAEFDGGLPRAEAERAALAGLLTGLRSLPPDPDAAPIEVPATGWRAEVAGWPSSMWLAWHRLVDQLRRHGATVEEIDVAEREAYESVRQP